MKECNDCNTVQENDAVFECEISTCNNLTCGDCVGTLHKIVNGKLSGHYFTLCKTCWHVKSDELDKFMESKNRSIYIHE